MIATWAMLLFECLFPLALFGAAMSPIVPLAFIAIAGLFHFSNVYIFALTAFFLLGPLPIQLFTGVHSSSSSSRARKV